MFLVISENRYFQSCNTSRAFTRAGFKSAPLSNAQTGQVRTGLYHCTLRRYKPNGSSFNLVRRHVRLNGVALCLKRGLWVQFLREICPCKKRTPKSGANIGAITWKLLTLWACSLQFIRHPIQYCFPHKLLFYRVFARKMRVLFYLILNWNVPVSHARSITCFIYHCVYWSSHVSA
jgi:hypothetical protein